MSTIKNIPGIFKIVAERVSAKLEARVSDPFPVYFSHGVYDSVRKELIEKGESLSKKNAKFPLIWLVTPTQQILYPRNSDAYCDLPDVQIFILQDTDASRSEEDNINECFVPRLRPVYEELIRQIDRSCLFQVLSAEAIPHEMKEWTYQHNTDGKNHLFNDYINCIQIKRLRLLVNDL